MQVKHDVREFVIRNFLFGQDTGLREDDSFLDQGIIDSTGVLELVSFIENYFHVKVHDADLTPDNLDSIRSVTAFVEARMNGADGGS